MPSTCLVPSGVDLVRDLRWKMRFTIWLCIGAVAATGLFASDLDEFKVKREPVFEFAQKPVVTSDGDKVTIEFETKGFCDVSVAIENLKGEIVRHLASGVLGENAPSPSKRERRYRPSSGTVRTIRTSTSTIRTTTRSASRWALNPASSARSTPVRTNA